MNPAFWKDKRVFLTGHTGFKGSWLSLWLQSLGARTTGYALDPPTDPSLFEMAGVSQGMASVRGDVRDRENLAAAVREASPEIVIHMAAQPLVRTSYEQPVETFHTNVLGTIHLMEAVRQTPGVRALVVVTSDKCYENREWFWSYREKSALGGDDPYSASKACAELAFAAYLKSFFSEAEFGRHGVACASVRAGNVIGGGDWAKDRLVPDSMRALLAGEAMHVRNAHSTRPWQHVLEPLNGYMTVAERLHTYGPRFVGSWNFGPSDGSERTTGWVVEKLHALWGASQPWTVGSTENEPHENTYLKLDSSKARALLDWTPLLDLPTTLEWVVSWNKALQSKADIRQVTVDQIRTFMALRGIEAVA